jgi:hypothetical protein
MNDPIAKENSRSQSERSEKKTKNLTVKEVLEMYSPCPLASSSFSRTEVF